MQRPPRRRVNDPGMAYQRTLPQSREAPPNHNPKLCLHGPKDACASVSSLRHKGIRRCRTTPAPQLPTPLTEMRNNTGHESCISPPWTLCDSLRLSNRN